MIHSFFSILVTTTLFTQLVFSFDIEAPPEVFEGQTMEIGQDQNKSKDRLPKNIIYKKDQKPLFQAKVVALVNREPITLRDLIDRLRMVSQKPLSDLSEEQYKGMKAHVLNTMIDEAVKRQTTARVGLKVSEKDLEHAINQIEKQNKMKQGGLPALLKEKNIPLSVLKKSVEADVAWRTYVGILAGNALDVNKKDLNHLAHTNTKGTQYSLAEIVLDKTHFENDYAKTLERLNEITEELSSGAITFVDAAFKYSHAPSATRGGQVGWISEDALEDAERKILKNLNVGEGTKPIQTDEGYKIYFVVEKKVKAEGEVDTLTARQLEIKLSPSMANAPEKREEQIKKLTALVSTVSKCEEFDQLTDQIPNAQIHVYKSVQPNDLSQDLKNILTRLKVGEPSQAIFNSANNTIVFFLVCAKNKQSPQEMKTNQALANQISGKRFLAISEQKLREAKRISSVEIRV